MARRVWDRRDGWMRSLWSTKLRNGKAHETDQLSIWESRRKEGGRGKATHEPWELAATELIPARVSSRNW